MAIIRQAAGVAEVIGAGEMKIWRMTTAKQL